MRKTISAFLLAAGAVMFPAPRPADALIIDPCLDDAVESCSSEFYGYDPYSVAIRGWCYLIRWAIC